MRHSEKAGIRPWAPVLSLSLAAFIFVSSELMPIGLLPDMSANLGKTEAFTGLLITFYAWVVALASLPMTILTEKTDRRKLLLGIFTVFTLSQAFSVMAPNFWLLLASRICIAFAHALFWSITTPLAARLAPKGMHARALTCIVTGASLATVLGVPIGSILGHHMGWRAVFAAVGGVAFTILVVLARTLPPLPSRNTNNMGTLPVLLHNRNLLLLYIITALAVTGNFTAFSYLAPFFQKVGGFSPEQSSFFLLAAGGSGIAGSMLASRFADRLPHRSILAGIFTAFVCVVLLNASMVSFLSTFVLCIGWGMGMAAIGLTLQTIILMLAKNSADVATSIYSGIFNVGIGFGALLGGRVYSDLGLDYVGYAAGAGFMGAFLLALFLRFGKRPAS